MFVLILATLLFSVRVSDAETGSSVWGKQSRPLTDYCITLVEGEITAEAGLCVVIPCSFTVPENIKVLNIVWFICKSTKGKCGEKDIFFNSSISSDQVQSEFKGRVSLLESDVSKKNCSIIVNDLKESDSGTYQLRVKASPRRGSYKFFQRATVSVKGLSQRPKVMIPPLTEGQLTTLTCTAPGLCSGSEPTFTWRWRGGGESDADLTGNITAFKTENVTEFAKRRSSTLSFSPSAKHHGTNITCTVLFQGHVSTEETATLSVSYPPPEPKLSMSSEVTEGQTITVSCTVESFPQSTLTLMRINTNNQVEIIPENNLNPRPINSLYHEFTVTSSDAGWYVCRAQNTEGSKYSKQKELVVTYPPTEPILSMSSEVTEGQTITISCSVESFPQSTLTLMKINTNPQSLKSTENNIYSRPINSLYHTFTVTSADAGWYVCRAQNTEGSKDSKQQKLVVNYKPRKTSISVSGSSDNQVKLGGSLTLTCDTDANPAPTTYFWSRSKNPQTVSWWKTTNRRELSLTIQRADEACYRCSSSNLIGGGDESQPVCIQVLYSPNHVTVQANPGFDVKENVLLTLSCSAKSNPPVSSVTWRKTTDGREKIIQQTQTQTFRVNSASPSDSGLYSCEATNYIGSGKSQPAEVKVRFVHTHITESAEKQELDGRSSVMLSCFSHSFPPVQHYSWYRKSQGEERMEIVSKHQNHTVYSNQSGVYYCIAQNEVDHSLSDPVHLFERDYLENLRFLIVALLLLMIISVIVVNLRYWRKSVQQGTTNNESPSGFLNEPESLQDYENISDAAARAPISPTLFDDHTSEGEVELNFPQVRFTATPRRQTTNRDSSSSHQDESLYSNVRI